MSASFHRCSLIGGYALIEHSILTYRSLTIAVLFLQSNSGSSENIYTHTNIFIYLYIYNWNMERNPNICRYKNTKKFRIFEEKMCIWWYVTYYVGAFCSVIFRAMLESNESSEDYFQMKKSQKVLLSQIVFSFKMEWRNQCPYIFSID